MPSSRIPARAQRSEEDAPLEGATTEDFRRFRVLTLREIRGIKKRLDGFNGSIEALAAVKASAPKLARLAEYVDQLIYLVEELTRQRLERLVVDADQGLRDQIFWLELRKRVNPFTKLGAAVWLLLTGFLLAAGAGIYKLLF